MIAFTMVNIHGPSRITEGGILGLSLLFKHSFGLDQSITSPILDGLAYLLAVTLLGKRFLKTSVVASVAYTASLFLLETQGPWLPSFYRWPILAAVLGGLCVGIGASFVIMQGGASGGDDALALVLSRKSGVKLAVIFLLMDVAVLGLSILYIPMGRLIWSFLTTFVSSWVIGQFESLIPKRREARRTAVTTQSLNSLGS